MLNIIINQSVLYITSLKNIVACLHYKILSLTELLAGPWDHR